MEYLYLPPAVTLRNSAVCPQNTICHNPKKKQLLFPYTGPIV